MKRIAHTLHQTGNELIKDSHYTQFNFHRYPLPLYGWIKHAIEENEINSTSKKSNPVMTKKIFIKFEIFLTQKKIV